MLSLQKYRYNESMDSEKITLFHGSPEVIEHPVFGVGNPKNDYGLGFYCTDNLELAKEWACAENRDGFANRYLLDCRELTLLNLSNGQFHILNWMAVLLKNRTFVINHGIAEAAREYILENFLPHYEDFDILRGYRADDSYFSFASAFLNNTISVEQLGYAMRLGGLGEQTVIMSRKAFDRLEFAGAEHVDAGEYYPKRFARDRKARDDFRREKDRGPLIDGTYIIDIVRNKWKNDDPRLR